MTEPMAGVTERPEPSSVLPALVLTGRGGDVYAAPPFIDAGTDRHFGGLLLAQALLAAAGTVPSDLPAHSLHAYFLRAGDPREEIEFAVTRVRDGRRLTSRSVAATQDGRLLATMTASFAAAAPGFEHQDGVPASPDPDTLPTLVEWADANGGFNDEWFTVRTVDTRVVPDVPDGRSLAWNRTLERLPDDPVIHQAMFVYLSDVTTLSGAMVPQGVPIGGEHTADRRWDALSLDHAVWFHRPVRADEWILFAQHSPAATGGRGLIRSDAFTLSGDLVASIAQEGLFFPVP